MSWRTHARRLPAVVALAAALVACAGPPRPGTAGADSAPAARVPLAVRDTAFAAVPDSVWIIVTGPTLIGFYPLGSNAELERDEGLATALDDFAYHIGSVMDSLTAAGVAMHYDAGDTVFVRTGDERWRFVRAPDSSSIGYLFADARYRRAVIYGVLGGHELLEHARQFARTGQTAR